MPGYYAVGPGLADAAKRLVRLYEAKNRERSVAVGAQSVEFLGVYFDILSLAEFVTGHDFVIRDFSVDRADLLVLDASTAASVQLVKMEVAFLPVEGIECLDREGHQTKGEIASPACPVRWTTALLFCCFGHASQRCNGRTD